MIKFLKMYCFICPKSGNGFVELNAPAVMNVHNTFSVASTPLLRFLQIKLQAVNEFKHFRVNFKDGNSSTQ